MKGLLGIVFIGKSNHLSRIRIILVLVICAIIVQTANAAPVTVRLSGKHKILHSNKYREHYYTHHQSMLKHRKASHTPSHHPHLLHYRAEPLNCLGTFTESKSLYDNLKDTESYFTGGMYGVGPHNLTRLANQTVEKFGQAVQRFQISPESNDLSTTLDKLQQVLRILNGKRENMERNPNQGLNHSRPKAYKDFMDSVRRFSNFWKKEISEFQEPSDEVDFKYLDETNSQKEYIFFLSYMEFVGLLNKVLHNNCDSVKSLS